MIRQSDGERERERETLRLPRVLSVQYRARTMFQKVEEFFDKLRSFNIYSTDLVTLSTIIGTLVIFYYMTVLAVGLFRGFRLYVLNQLSCCRTDFRKKYGQWAIVTGSTDGIGLALAKELARRGHSIIVVGRNQDKLNRTEQALLKEPNVGEVMTVKIDLSDSSIENYRRVEELIDPSNRDIGVLINCAGTLSSVYKRFNNHDKDYLRCMVNVNILATVNFTRMIMPSMIARGRGLVMNVSSMLGSLSIPLMAVYGPTKSFVNQFSQDLQFEYSQHPIDIINLETGPVHTKLFDTGAKLDESSKMIPTSDEYARSALNAASTPVKSMNGIMSHAIMMQISLLIKSLGLYGPYTRFNIRAIAKNVELSPIPKRKQQVDRVATNNAGIV